MGCDIHTIAQIKKGKKWETVAGHVGGDSRDYDTFAVLADVRNGSGFAGVETGEGWEVLFPPRGLPKDLEFLEEREDTDDQDGIPENTVATPPWQYNYQIQDGKGEHQTDQWLGDHSHSHLLLSEIKKIRDHFAKKFYEHRGFVDKKHYLDVLAGKFPHPQEWCGGVDGPSVVKIDQEKLEREVGKNGKPLNKDYTHVRMKWSVPALDTLYLLPRQIEAMEALAKEHGVEDKDIRLVFGFDS